MITQQLPGELLDEVCAATAQDPATKCTDPADKNAVIRDLRIEKNALLDLIENMRDDVEVAHRNVEGAIKHRKSERLTRATRALQNVIESMGVRP
ncbi:MAG: hypothetical protein KAJ03_04365 [Gammaproteobacteria bacterium]|nr:hypothetical protein [Gammaproteobacteria bacterium]